MATGRDVALICAVKASISAVVLAVGFRALSDDDYARVVIAQSFAHSPSLDPSGTSWLPLPFWVYGSVLALVGRSLEAARALSFLLGVAAAALVYVAARWLETPRGPALAAAAVGAALPYSALLSVATVPDAPVAALILAGAASVASVELRVRLWGALALAAAVASRYEAWPVALGFLFLCLRDALRQRKSSFGLVGLVPVIPAAAWMLHGAIHHGSALFFVVRVTAYRSALGEAGVSLGQQMLTFPKLLVLHEPALMLMLLAALVAAWRFGLVARYERAALLMALLFVFLVLGELRGGGATHHPERALLPIWWFSTIIVFSALDAMSRAKLTHALLAAAAILLLRPWSLPAVSHRQSEIGVGKAARSELRASDKIVIDTRDFGFYAVIAAFGRPEDAEPLHDHDPRKPSPRRPDTLPELRRWLAERHASWLIAPAERRSELARLGDEHFHNAAFTLIALRKTR